MDYWRERPEPSVASSKWRFSVFRLNANKNSSHSFKLTIRAWIYSGSELKLTGKCTSRMYFGYVELELNHGVSLTPANRITKFKNGI